MTSSPLAIITGGTSGIGLAIAKTLTTTCDLALIYKSNDAHAAEAVKILEGTQKLNSVATFKCDVGNYEESKTTYEKIKKKFGSTASILVNSAGVASRNLFTQEDISTIQTLVSTNLLGTIFMSRLVIGDMYKNKSGKIINISSIAGLGGHVGMTVYGATKAGIDSFSKSLASEVGHRNIQVNVILPGLVETEMTRTIVSSTTHLVSNVRKENLINKPYGEFIKSNDVAELARFLIQSASAKAINGASFTIDGGSANFRQQIKQSNYDAE